MIKSKGIFTLLYLTSNCILPQFVYLEKKPTTDSKLWHGFCNTSSIHGVNFISLHNSMLNKALWTLVVIGGIALAAVVINQSFEQWEKHPIITSVAQISIEQIESPSVTVCSLDDSRYVKYSFIFNYTVSDHKNVILAHFLF